MLELSPGMVEAQTPNAQFVVTLRGDDLPCPWCQAPTTEADPRCPSCDRRFG